jgi:exosortase/archaeosortase family protein
MFVFASFVYLTGDKIKAKWKFIIGGLIFLHVVNIIRLTALFMYVQNNSDLQMAMDHHQIYNIVFYSIIFVLWIIWIEKFVLKKETKKN